MLCETFTEGVFANKENKIFLCANALHFEEDYNNALNRMLIKLYDSKWSIDYDFNNCKHLACTEIWAASFSSNCGMKLKGGGLNLTNSDMSEKSKLDDFCVK